MKGYPKHGVGDTVTFKFGQDMVTGKVEIVDAFGCFLADDVTYDVFVPDENMLYKHIPENQIIKNE